jgi:hypothetical protein
MSAPLILSDNIFDSTVLHPGYLVGVVDSTDTPTTDTIPGNDVWRIADNLRDLTSWTCSTANAIRRIQVDCGAAVTMSMVVLDRGHNLAGAAVKVNYSTNAWSTSTTALTATVPSTIANGALPTATGGTTTVENVWWAEFTPVSARYWEFYIPALGSGIAPQVTGLYIGKGFYFPEYVTAPAALDYRTRMDVQQNKVSRAGVRVMSRKLNYAELDIKLDLEDSEYVAFDANVRTLLRLGAPWWVCINDASTVLSGLMRLYQLNGQTTYDPVADPVFRHIELKLEEAYPLVTN